MLDIHLLVLATLLEAVLDPTQEDQVKLPDIFLVADGQLIPVIINDRGEHRGGVDVFAIRRDKVTKQLLEALNQPTAR